MFACLLIKCFVILRNMWSFCECEDSFWGLLIQAGCMQHSRTWHSVVTHKSTTQTQLLCPLLIQTEIFRQSLANLLKWCITKICSGGFSLLCVDRWKDSLWNIVLCTSIYFTANTHTDVHNVKLPVTENFFVTIFWIYLT
jgi:hypothetical protein